MEAVLRLMRLTDETLGDETRKRRERLFAAYTFAKQVWEVLATYPKENPFPWQEVNEALQATPLVHEKKIDGILDGYYSGGIPDWCWEWARDK